jgi:hypothetical protein
MMFRCGFKMETIMRKHRIVRNRNRDSALYVILNSEWLETAVKLKKYLGIDPKPKTIKLADIEEPDKLFPAKTIAVVDDSLVGGDVKKEGKKKARSKKK